MRCVVASKGVHGSASQESHALPTAVCISVLHFGLTEERVGGTSDQADTPNSPAIRYLNEVFRVLREKASPRSDVMVESGNILSPDRNALAYWIRKYNAANTRSGGKCRS